MSMLQFYCKANGYWLRRCPRHLWNTPSIRSLTSVPLPTLIWDEDSHLRGTEQQENGLGKASFSLRQHFHQGVSLSSLLSTYCPDQGNSSILLTLSREASGWGEGIGAILEFRMIYSKHMQMSGKGRWKDRGKCRKKREFSASTLGLGGSSDTLSIKSQTVGTFSLVGNYSVTVA